MPMEQAFRHCDRDTLKMAMLKHEETFRQQVSSESFDHLTLVIWGRNGTDQNRLL
jgi:hypothetical protein